jgi:hypothetical protein
MNLDLEEISVFDDKYDAAIIDGERLLQVHPVKVNHVPIAQILRRDNVKILAYNLWYILMLGSSDPVRQCLTYLEIKAIFSNLGFGDINRFYPEDSEEFFNKNNVTNFLTMHFIYILRESQIYLLQMRQNHH